MTFPVAKMLALCSELTHVFEDTVSVIFLKSFGEEVWILFSLKRTTPDPKTLPIYFLGR